MVGTGRSRHPATLLVVPQAVHVSVRATLSTLTLGDLRVFSDTILLVEDRNEASGKSGRNPAAVMDPAQ